MFKKDHFIPPLSSFELRRQASIERNLAIQACTRAAVRASAKWLRMLLQRSTRLARDLTAERRRRSAIRELHRFDDRTLEDIGVHRGDIEFAVRHGLPTRRASRLNITGTALLHVSALLGSDHAIAAHHRGE
jgi:uncharacterized protein YjiS (DUF1127 family)